MVRRVPLLLVLAALLAGCSDGGGTGAPGRVETVGAVTLEVPRGWDRDDEPIPSGVVAQESWQASGGAILQVVVGCGDESAEELAHAAAASDRSPLVVTAAQETADAEMDGLDDAHRTLLTLGGGRPDDADTARLAGLYGSGAGGLVLIEYSAPVARYDRGRVDRVFESVRVDAATLSADCSSH